MKQSLSNRLSQHLALTPQLQQSIRLLQLSTLELQKEIEQTLADNPLLELAEDWLDGATPISADSELEGAGSGAADGEAADEFFAPAADHAPVSSAPDDSYESSPSYSMEAAADGEADAPIDTDSGSDWILEDFVRRPLSDDDDETPTQLQAASVTLREHLLGQLRMLNLSDRDRGLLTFLMESLDENGYLDVSLEEVLAELPGELEVEPEELETALSMLQSCDPPGVGARSAGECLALQLERMEEHPSCPLALEIVRHHLEQLAARDFNRLRRALQVDDAAIKTAHDLIRSLAPFPGRTYGKPVADYVVPDVIVKRGPHGWRAELNSEVIPRLRINSMYAQILRGNPGAASLQQKLQEARWLIRNIEQRFDTILRVSRAIVERQKLFFTHGEIAMRPLVLREIADMLDLNKSTISRVTTNKFMATPLGTFEMKCFFGSHISTETGGAASSTAIRALIKQLVGAENSRKPLSDSCITELLGEQGFVVARRTVAKYREALKIPPVSMRKSL
ncbi:MAG: RNA polymerase factor sigma-54 [Candidatus Protistobacter heckmanni]|nr:RNA polymerase factor sigma-54 [Candidatus Protistobacter heckmanni]